MAYNNIAAELITAFQLAWQAIQQQHPDVPTVVITFGSGTLGVKPGRERLGHFAAGRWQHKGSEILPELFVTGEGLRRGATSVLGTLLHEAAHGIANIRNISDTSRQGRYHNRHYKALAEELGLVVEQDTSIGWSATQVPDATANRYTAEITAIDAALVAYRRAEPRTSSTKNTNLIAATCICARRIRVAPRTLAQAPIICGVCRTGFTAAHG